MSYVASHSIRGSPRHVGDISHVLAIVLATDTVVHAGVRLWSKGRVGSHSRTQSHLSDRDRPFALHPTNVFIRSLSQGVPGPRPEGDESDRLSPT